MNWKKKFKVLDYKKRNNFKIFYSSAILIASESDIMEEIVLKNHAREDWIVLDVIRKHIIKIFDC